MFELPLQTAAADGPTSLLVDFVAIGVDNTTSNRVASNQQNLVLLLGALEISGRLRAVVFETFREFLSNVFLFFLA